MSVIASLKKKLNKTSFNSLTRLGVDWRSLICNNKELAKQYTEYINTKENYIMVSTDYSQLEIFVLASLSGDKTLIEAVNSGMDIHSFNASKVYNIDYQSIKNNLALAIASGNDADILHYNMLWDDFYQKRKFIKALSFSLSYGAGSGKIAHDLRLTIAEAEKLISDFYSTYPQLRIWQGKTLLKAIQTGYLETPFMRKRATQELKGRQEAYQAFIKEDKATIKRLKQSGEYWNLRNEFKTVLNTNVQSTASDMCSLAAIKINKAFKKSNLRAKLYFWVHDSVLFSVHIDDVIPAIKLVSDIMENQVKYEGDPVNYRVESEIGYTYEYMEKLERKDLIGNNITKQDILNTLDKSLDADINKKFKLIVKASSSDLMDAEQYIKDVKEAKQDYFNDMVSSLNLPVHTPIEYMAYMNNCSVSEYEDYFNSELNIDGTEEENED